MKHVMMMLACCVLLSACGSTGQRYTQYASWDNMYYYDPSSLPPSSE